ncbi:uncharacterized protein J4E79_007523 [Alternaria viburni]|uniref:uncharacterized protein n=1 Tax=Alternaria viburni TaxID=566460 RepID=UPI0020C496CF|nr:uncharacterized protein J4E79_007523 [Alternaria viburni]KAI4657449.1 hypothetical protein J4E79_007523 [Alternaria viburni]
MALSNPASGTALSVTSTPDADLSSALGILAMQDPSIPTPGECHIDRCAIETLIQVAESLDNKGLCSLARASKRYTEAAQDVLYRVVDLRSDYPNREHKSTFDRPTKSGLAVFLCTIKQKPHLATKVKDLWFLPRSRVVKVCEKKLACDLLARLTELRSLTITALDDCLCSVELAGEDIFEGLPTPLQELALKRTYVARHPTSKPLISHRSKSKLQTNLMTTNSAEPKLFSIFFQTSIH